MFGWIHLLLALGTKDKSFRLVGLNIGIAEGKK